MVDARKRCEQEDIETAASPSRAAHNAQQPARLNLKRNVVQNLTLRLVGKVDVAKLDAAAAAALWQGQRLGVGRVLNLWLNADEVEHVLYGVKERQQGIGAEMRVGCAGEESCGGRADEGTGTATTATYPYQSSCLESCLKGGVHWFPLTEEAEKEQSWRSVSCGFKGEKRKGTCACAGAIPVVGAKVVQRRVELNNVRLHQAKGEGRGSEKPISTALVAMARRSSRRTMKSTKSPTVSSPCDTM